MTLNPSYSAPEMGLGSSMATPYKSPDVTPYLVVIPRLNIGAASLLLYPPWGKYNSKERPCIAYRSHSFQFIQGEPTRGLAGIYFMPTSVITPSSIIRLCLIVPYLTGFVKVNRHC